MFTIDLLKGQGIPIKSRPEGILVSAVTLVVPLLAGIALVCFYMTGRVAVAVQKQQVAGYSKQIEKLAEAVAQQESYKRETISQNGCLAEVSANIDRHTLWTPILVTVVESMPDSMVMTKLEVKRKSDRRSVPKKDDPMKMVDVNVMIQRLLINITGDPKQDHDQAVKSFTERLRFSETLGPKLEKIEVEQKTTKNGQQEELSYEIDCVFKPHT
jgi:hypothetical protein